MSGAHRLMRKGERYRCQLTPVTCRSGKPNIARRVIFVEGAAELMMVDALAKRMNFNLRQHGVSLISVEGLNFDSFLPLFGDNVLKIPVAVLTDADPVAPKVVSAIPAAAPSATPVAAPAATPAGALPAALVAGEDPDEDDDEDAEPVYPAPGDTIVVSANTAKMKTYEDGYVKVFHGLKTFLMERIPSFHWRSV